jgi:GT2 family glycosyltransferase
MADKVAIVVLSHNALKVSQKFVKHLEANTDPDKFTLLWIDNGSTDGTTAYLERMLEESSRPYDMHGVFEETNKGVIGGRNIGFEAFFGEVDGIDLSGCNYLMFIDNDQYVKKGWLEQHLSVANKGYDIVGVEAWQMGSSFIPTQRNFNISQWYSFVGCGGSLIRRTCAEKVGRYDMVFNPSYYEDPDYCWRALNEGMKIGWNISARIIHEAHQTLGVAKDKNQRFINSLKAFRAKWTGHPIPSLLMQKIPELGLP